MSRDSRIGTYKVEMVDCQARRLGKRRYRLPNNNRQIYNVGLMKPAQPTKLADLKIPPGNRLEALRGGRAGQYSIRVNDQWRICFQWDAAEPGAVEIVDYH